MWHPARVAQRPAQQHLDVGVEASELVSGPAGQGIVDRGSKDTLNDAVDAADRANLAVYTIYFKGEEERSMGGFPGGGPIPIAVGSSVGGGGFGAPGATGVGLAPEG